MRGIEKRYGTIQALRGVDLALAPGEVLGLVGDNAAGKSTLTKILAGAEVPDAGQIFIDGRLVRVPVAGRRPPPTHRDGLPGSVAVRQHRRGGEFISRPRQPQRRWLGFPLMQQKKMHAEAAAILAGLDIRVDSTRLKVANLSGGQRQSIAIGGRRRFTQGC